MEQESPQFKTSKKAMQANIINNIRNRKRAHVIEMRAGIVDGGFRWDGTPMKASNGAQSLRSKSPMRTGGYARNGMRSSSSGRHQRSPLRDMIASASHERRERELMNYPNLAYAEEQTSLPQFRHDISGIQARNSRSPLRGRSNGKRVTINEQSQPRRASSRILSGGSSGPASILKNAHSPLRSS